MMMGSEEWTDAIVIFFNNERICFDILLEMRLSLVLFSNNETEDGGMRITSPLRWIVTSATTTGTSESHPASLY